MLSRLPFLFALFAALLVAPSPGLAEDLESKATTPLFSFKTDDREPLFGERFTLKVGYKVWIAKWQAPAGFTSNGPVQATADHPSAMHGPAISGSLKLQDSKWFNSLFFSATSIRDGFDFQERGFLGSQTHDYATRRDTTVTGGLAIWEGFGVYGGYYNSDQDFTSYFNGALLSRNTRSLKGPLVGVFGTVPTSERVSVYGNLAYAMFKLNSSPKSGSPGLGFSLQTNSAHGYVSELGVNIAGPRFWRIGTELQAGFRAQIINKTIGTGNIAGGTLLGGSIINDITYGPIFTLNAVF